MSSLRLDDKDAVASVAHDFDERISLVPSKYHGTDADKHEMRMLGKRQVLRVLYHLCLVPIRVLTHCSATSPFLPCSALLLPVSHLGKASSHTSISSSLTVALRFSSGASSLVLSVKFSFTRAWPKWHPCHLLLEGSIIGFPSFLLGGTRKY